MVNFKVELAMASVRYSVSRSIPQAYPSGWILSLMLSTTNLLIGPFLIPCICVFFVGFSPVLSVYLLWLVPCWPFWFGHLFLYIGRRFILCLLWFCLLAWWVFTFRIFQDVESKKDKAVLLNFSCMYVLESQQGGKHEEGTDWLREGA